MKFQLKVILLVICLVVICVHLAASGTQHYTVTGSLKCGISAARGVKVKLVDEDDGPDPDDKLDSTRTDNNGRFRLSGSTFEVSKIEPRLKIYHDCDDGIKPCQRKWKIKLPKKYIDKNEGINVGEWNLEVRLPDEERDCIH